MLSLPLNTADTLLTMPQCIIQDINIESHVCKIV